MYKQISKGQIREQERNEMLRSLTNFSLTDRFLMAKWRSITKTIIFRDENLPFMLIRSVPKDREALGIRLMNVLMGKVGTAPLFNARLGEYNLISYALQQKKYQMAYELLKTMPSLVKERFFRYKNVLEYAALQYKANYGDPNSKADLEVLERFMLTVAKKYPSLITDAVLSYVKDNPDLYQALKVRKHTLSQPFTYKPKPKTLWQQVLSYLNRLVRRDTTVVGSKLKTA